MRAATAWLEHRQVTLALLALCAGVAFGVAVPGGDGLIVLVPGVLVALLFATFLAVPFSALITAMRDLRFLGTVAIVNFIVASVVAFVLSRFVADDDALLFGTLLVLLAPCVDYVISFTRAAGGDAARLLAAAPLLMLGQIVLLPAYLWLFLGDDARDTLEVGPFLEAFVVYIAVPLAAAIVLQLLARRRPSLRTVESAVSTAMVPLLMATIFVVVASQVRFVASELGVLVRVVPLFAVFAVVMLFAGIAAARMSRMDAASARAVVFAGVTRNSLVVLPLTLAVPPSLALAPAVVVSQTLVELVVMVILVRVVPHLVPLRGVGRPQRRADPE